MVRLLDRAVARWLEPARYAASRNEVRRALTAAAQGSRQRGAFRQALPGLVYGLSERGFGDTEIRGLLGENFRRVAATVWTPQPS